MSSKSDEKASLKSSSAADNTEHAKKSDTVVTSSSAKNNGTSKNNDDGDEDDLLYADLAALSIQPTLSSSSTKTATSSTSTTSPLSWHLWRYNCRDFPVHGCNYPLNCGFCTEVNKLRKVCPNAEDESQERWLSYLKRRDRAFDDAQSVLKYVKTDSDGVLPSKLAQKVFFNNKLGTAFFRAGISPEAESPENKNGGSFQLLLMTTTGAANHQLVKSFDKLFVHTVQLLAELPELTQKCINGVFYRCEINPGKRLPRVGWDPEIGLDTYRDNTDLPFMGKLEVWIGDAEQGPLVDRELISKVHAQLQNLGIPSQARRDFNFINRPKWWEEQKQRKKLPKLRAVLANGKK